MPQGWVEATLGSILPLNYGKGLIKEDRDSTGKVPVYGSSGQVGWHSEALTQNPTLIVGRKGTVGSVFYSFVPCWAIDTTYYFELDDENINLLYFYHLLSSINLRHSDNSSIVPGLNRNNYNAIKVPIAPFAEQQRIVEELETQFSRLDEAIKSLNRLQTNLQRFRASILKWAFEGKLVPTEAELARQEKRQYESAHELLKRILEERRIKWEADQLAKMEIQGKLPENGKWKEKYIEPKVINERDFNELPEGWTRVCSDTFFYFITSGSRGWAAYYSNRGALFLRIGNLNHNSISLDLSKIQRVNPPEGTEGVRTKVEANDILISITADVGMTALVPENIELAYINQHVALARPVESVNRMYLAWYLASEYGQTQFSEMQRGVTKVGLGLEDIKSVSVPLPPFNEQSRIIEEIERRFAVINKIEIVVKTNLQRSESLRRKILQDAFAGKLVKQNPNDEPASILLERIKTERERRETKLKEERRKKTQTMKHNKMERREIIEVLKESKTEMTPEQLFNAAGFNPAEVEEFYAELKKADDEKIINQQKKNNGNVYLTAKV